jgi:hypothetical protein
MSILKKRKRVIGEKFPLTRSLAETRAAFRQMEKDQAADHADFIKRCQKPVASSPAERIPEIVSGSKIASLAEPVPTGQHPGDGLVQPLPGEREPMFLP